MRKSRYMVGLGATVLVAAGCVPPLEKCVETPCCEDECVPSEVYGGTYKGYRATAGVNTDGYLFVVLVDEGMSTRGYRPASLEWRHKLVRDEGWITPVTEIELRPAMDLSSGELPMPDDHPFRGLQDDVEMEKAYVQITAYSRWVAGQGLQ